MSDSAAQSTTSRPDTRPLVSRTDWIAAAKDRYGNDTSAWKFRCPVCGTATSVGDWKEAGAPEGAVAFSCVGRWAGGRDAFECKGRGPCNYTGGGLFKLNPVRVIDEKGREHLTFDFADRPLETEAAR